MINWREAGYVTNGDEISIKAWVTDSALGTVCAIQLVSTGEIRFIIIGRKPYFQEPLLSSLEAATNWLEEELKKYDNE